MIVAYHADDRCTPQEITAFTSILKNTAAMTYSCNHHDFYREYTPADVDVKFPFIHTSKKELVSYLKSNVINVGKSLFDLTWWCEFPNTKIVKHSNGTTSKKIVPCNECNPCKLMKRVLWEYKEDNKIIRDNNLRAACKATN